MTFELAWKPRWATTRLVNSWPRSTLDISSAWPWRKPRPVRPGAQVRLARVDRDAVHRLAGLLQARRVVEVRQGELCQGLLQAVGEHADDHAVLGDAERGQRAHRGTVLRGRRDRVLAGVSRDRGQVDREPVRVPGKPATEVTENVKGHRVSVAVRVRRHWPAAVRTEVDDGAGGGVGDLVRGRCVLVEHRVTVQLVPGRSSRVNVAETVRSVPSRS